MQLVHAIFLLSSYNIWHRAKKSGPALAGLRAYGFDEAWQNPVELILEEA
jgi:hypothetical protein